MNKYKSNTNFITRRTYSMFGDVAIPVPCPTFTSERDTVNASAQGSSYELPSRLRQRVTVQDILRSNVLRPTAYATEVADRLISDTQYGIDWMGANWMVTADEDGGLSMEWVKDETHSLTVEIPPDATNEPYLYIERPGVGGKRVSGIISSITHNDLVLWFRRLGA